MRSIGPRRVVIIFAISLALPAAAHASGDAAAGKTKSLTCAACHISSNPAAEAPHLVGQRAAYLAAQLQAFRRGDRADPLMNPIARQLSDADIDDLAAFWSTQPAGSDARPLAATDPITRSHMGFPRNFPRDFVLYLTSNNAELNTVKKTYINTLGFQAARTSKPLPDGTVILVATYAARLGPDKKPVIDKDGSWAVDKITAYSGMEARSGWGSDIPSWVRNDSWNYAAFTPDQKPRDVNQAPCLACHKAQSVVSYVFTFKELWDKARMR
ncbi:MAG TPA: cytochrome P460 family protein [Kofleriaceae bacterium]